MLHINRCFGHTDCIELYDYSYQAKYGVQNVEEVPARGEERPWNSHHGNLHTERSRTTQVYFYSRVNHIVESVIVHLFTYCSAMPITCVVKGRKKGSAQSHNLCPHIAGN